ncbi:MAG: dihydrodipicolinate synthase family protein [Trueperaceae bacterium]|nr:dihydrodipicolinate synthase family protein [Trueperaceae bacterium]
MRGAHEKPALRGVNPILPTPFKDDGTLDLASLRRLIDFQIEAGAHGVAILGFLGEAHKLTGEERRQVVDTVVERADGRFPVWVGVRAFGTAGAIEQAQEAEARGAAAVFVAPIAPQSDASLYAHYRRVAEAVGIPLILHDYPASFGITLSPHLIGRLARDGFAPYIKLEDPPVLQKLSDVLDASEGTIGVFGGLGGQYFLEELERGAVGIMTGFAFPEVLVRIFEQFDAGDHEGATRTFYRYVGLIRYEFQPRIGLAFRKHVYQKRGVFASAHVRAPGATLDARTVAELERTVQRVGLSLDAGVRAV